MIVKSCGDLVNFPNNYHHRFYPATDWHPLLSIKELRKGGVKYDRNSEADLIERLFKEALHEDE